MKLKFLFVTIFILSSTNIYCQNPKLKYQSNFNVDFSDFFSGVQYAYLVVSEKDAKFLNDYPNGTNAQAILGIIDYLEEIGFTNTKWGTLSNRPQNVSSLCDWIIIDPTWGFQNGTYTDIRLTLVSCNQDRFVFESDKNVRVNDFTSVRSAFHNRCIKMIGKRIGYSYSSRLALPSEMTKWNEQNLKSHFQETAPDEFEGIYESTSSSTSMPKYKIGVLKDEQGYELIYLDGAKNFIDWKEGEVKARITPTATEVLFKANWKMGNKIENPDAYITFELGIMNLVMQNKEKTVFIKLYPTANERASSNKYSSGSGTGFGISSNGLIVTNSHVVTGASKISVRGTNGNFDKALECILLIEDKNNDLAIIQITDPSFVSLGKIPFTIANKSSDVGSPIFVLGYPLKAVMGDEVKLTNGIISSKSGFQGDVTSYQISAPLQPGNSGGPLFNSAGDLVGIVNSKLKGGENVSYAIKSSYLLNLIDLLPKVPKLQTINSLTGKQLPEQVKLLNNSVFIIEVK